MAVYGVGARMRRLMAEHKLDRRSLAEATGVSPAIIGKWLKGKLPAPEIRDSLCQALKTSRKDFFFGDVDTAEL